MIQCFGSAANLNIQLHCLALDSVCERGEAGPGQCDAAGLVVLKLKTPWRDGTTHLVMSPLEFMQRLAALVPRPKLHLIRFKGVATSYLPNYLGWFRALDRNAQSGAMPASLLALAIGA